MEQATENVGNGGITIKTSVLNYNYNILEWFGGLGIFEVTQVNDGAKSLNVYDRKRLI